MLDRDKVIRGLECHADPGGNCLECPYGEYGVDDNGLLECENIMALETLELLKEQEPMVLTLDEVKQLPVGEPVFIEENDNAVHYSGYNCMFTFNDQFVTFAAFNTDCLFYDTDKYTKTWRCWSSRPTDEQMEAVKWNDRD